MGRVELKHYPASKLPPELRGVIKLDSLVTITVEEVDRGAVPLTGTDMRAYLTNTRSKLANLSQGQAAEQVRKLRDEWDD
jgi:hypothetical protein